MMMDDDHDSASFNDDDDMMIMMMMCMTGTPPATRPLVYSPFLLETLRRLSGERSCDPRGLQV